MSDEQTIVVTGASSGIGLELARAAAARGMRVVAVARRADRLETLAKEIRERGGSCAIVPVDVCAPGAAKRIVDAALAQFGRIDVVVNNAGAGSIGHILDCTDAQLQSQIDLHVLAPLRIARAALPALRESHGQLVFLGSGIARVPIANYAGYSLAKAAIRAASTQLRRELAGEEIAVTYVDPGLVSSEFHATLGIERPAGITPATPEYVARAILRGIDRRSAVVNAVWWQTAGTIAIEWLGVWADSLLGSAIPPDVATPPAPAASLPQPQPGPAPVVYDDPFLQALAPVERRMERVNLPTNVLRDALTPGATLELSELAMRWAGMPNKNERAATREALDALCGAGYLEPTGEETWKVLRAAR